VTLSVDQVTVSAGSTSIGLETLRNFLHVTAASSDAIDASHVNAAAGASHNIAWSFDSGSEAFDFLADGETLQLTYSIKVDDGHGGVDTQDVAITVTGTNDAPVLSSASSVVATDEDTALAINGLGYSDVDGGSAAEQVTLHVDHGTIVLGDAGAVTGDLDGSDGTLVLNGTAAQINAALASGLTYTPASNYNGTDTLHLAATDQNAGPDGAGIDSLDLTINVVSVNDAPTTDSSASGNPEDTPLLLSLFGADVDGTVSFFRITTPPQHGALFLDEAGTQPIDPDHIPASVNHASIWFRPDANFNGGTSFQFVAVDDQGAEDATPATYNVSFEAVNDAPVFAGNGLSPTYSAGSDPISIVSNVSASDIDSDHYTGGTLTATVTAGGNEGDTLSIVDNQYIALSGTTVLYDADGDGPGGSVAIGTLTNYDFNSLTVTLNGAADDAAVEKLTRAIEFSNSKPDPVAGERTVTFTLHDGGGIANGGHDSDFFSTTVTVAASGSAAAQAPALVSQTFLGGAGDQGAADVSYTNGHLYLVYNSLPQTQTTSDNSTVVSFSTAADDAPTQDFSQSWNRGFFNGVASDGANIYAVGASNPGAGLTHDDSGGTEDKTMLAIFNANGTAGSNPSPATGYTDDNFFSYRGVEIFQNALATTQGGNTVVYAAGFGQPASYGAYVIASYDSSGNLLHTATDPLAVPGFSIARDVVEFNGQIWAVGYTEHSGDAVGRAVVWAASYDLSSVATYKDTVESTPGNFNSAAVIGSNLYAVGYVNGNAGDYLVAKYNTDGSIAWSHSFGGTGADQLNGAVALNGHLYVVGSTTDATGNTDGVLMEISTVDGSVVSTTSYGGALYDAFNSITTDGHYLYVAGESRSFAGGGNVAGSDDAILLTYDVGGGPVIDTEHFTTASDGNNEPTTVTGLSVIDSNASETLTLSATTAEAGVGSTIAPPSGSGDLSAINTAIGTVVYDPGPTPPDNDKVTFTVSGASGSDTVNFVFIQAGTAANPTLVGTSGKDVIFGTEGNDTLTGGGGHDQFVFSAADSGNVQHTITDFETPLDKLDLREISFIDELTDITVAQQGSDTLITLDTHNTILLQNVQAANLHASNFIFHSGNLL
jgi:VCBS repeat-containing protein